MQVRTLNTLSWTNPYEIDLSDGQGVIYFIRVVDDSDREYRYIGCTYRAKSRLQTYVRNIKRIHAGLIRCKTEGQEKYRAVHLALAKAVENGWEYDFYPVESAPVEILEMAESRAIRDYKCNLNKIGFCEGVLGTWSVDEYDQLVLNDFVESNTQILDDANPHEGEVALCFSDGTELVVEPFVYWREQKAR